MVLSHGPTRARIPAGPDAGEVWSGLATYHVVSRTVRDSAVFLDVAQGPEPGDPYVAPRPERDFLAEVGRDLGRLRIALWTEGLCGEPIDPQCVLAAERVARMLEDLGHEVTPAVPPVSGSECRRAINHDPRRAHRPKPHPGRSAPPSRRSDMMGDDLDVYLDRMWGHMAFTPLYNLSGCPAASLPMHMTPDGLPVGIQIGAAFGNEALLFRLSSQLEEAHPWWDRRP